MGSRQAAVAQSHLTRQTLDDPDLQAALRTFIHLVDACVGPHGRIQSLQNCVGGPITSTTSSSRLLTAMSFSRPCLRLIASSVQGHLRNHHDGGLLTAGLCLHLVSKALGVDSVGRQSVRAVYEVLLQCVDEYLHAKDCPIIVSVDTSKVRVMLAYVRSILCAKPLCGLRSVSADHLSQLVLKAVLTSVPDSPASFMSDRIFSLHLDHRSIMDSQLLDGLLLEWWEKPGLLAPQALGIITTTCQEIKVALVNVSMSGDVEESLTNQVEAEQQALEAASEHVLQKMREFCDWLCDSRVGLLLCQKVIHPRIKSYLRHRGVVFIDRLGLNAMAYIHDLTGAGFISSILTTPAEDMLGQLSTVTHRVLHNKSYLQLQRNKGCVCTLLLCAAVEEQLAELKCAVQSAVTGLYCVLQRPYLVCGGGCWQSHLANFVKRVALERTGELCAQLHLTKTQLYAACHAFAASLLTSARSVHDPSFQTWIDRTQGHLWPAPPGVDIATETAPFSCACGILMDRDIDKESCQLLGSADSCQAWSIQGDSGCRNAGPLSIGEKVNMDWLVLDTMETVVSALRTAVMTAATVLSINQYIQDVN